MAFFALKHKRLYFSQKKQSLTRKLWFCHMDPYINFESHVHLTVLTDLAAAPGTKNRPISQNHIS